MDRDWAQIEAERVLVQANWDNNYRPPHPIDLVKVYAAALRQARAEGRREGLLDAAMIAAQHKGSAQKARYERGQTLNKIWPEEARDEIQAEERGEDIASEIIERNIRALAQQDGPAEKIPNRSA